MILEFLKVFLVGGTICAIGQLLLDYTKLTSARILVLFLLIGVALQALNLYQPIVDFGGSGATVPIVGFGYLLAKGAMEGAKIGFLEALTGGLSAAAVGLTAAIVFGYLNALIFRSRTKKQ